MNDWQQKQVKFDQLPVDVDAINRTMIALNQTAVALNSNLTSVEADIKVSYGLLKARKANDVASRLTPAEFAHRAVQTLKGEGEHAVGEDLLDNLK